MTLEALAFYSPVDSPQEWRAAVAHYLPDLSFNVWPEVGDPNAVRYALVWQPPEGFFQTFPNLSLVTNLGAGVDAILARKDLPDVPIARITDPHLARMMASYVVFAVLRYYRDMPALEQAKLDGRWNYIHPREPERLTVGVMGLGQLGSHAAKELARWGFRIKGWALSRHEIDGVEEFVGDRDLEAFLCDLDILVVMLPSTPKTRGIITGDVFAAMPRGAKFINVARGELVDEAALLDALRSGQIGEATLDVFQNEPLPPDHPFWSLPQVFITPHLASVASPRTAVEQLAENIKRIRRGEAPLRLIDRTRGY